MVEENLHKEQAVERLIRETSGRTGLCSDIWHASLASDKDKADAIYGTMLAARRLRDSKKVMEHLSHPQVERVFELSRKVGSEAHNYKGFLRFRELSGGIYVWRNCTKEQDTDSALLHILLTGFHRKTGWSDLR